MKPQPGRRLGTITEPVDVQQEAGGEGRYESHFPNLTGVISLDQMAKDKEVVLRESNSAMLDRHLNPKPLLT